MRAWDLPTSLVVGGEEWAIRSDYKAILDILCYLNDPEYEDCKMEIMLDILYVDFANMPTSLYKEAMERGSEFIDAGIPEDRGNSPRVMDWEQDAPIIIPAINRVLGYEVRGKDIHWWTFLGGYLEIGESLYSNILGIRVKRAKGKPLEKHEKEFLRENKHLVDLKIKLTEEEQIEYDAEQKALKELLGG